MLKRFTALLLVMFFLLPILTAHATPAAPGGDASANAQAALYVAIRGANPALVPDDGLQRIAVAYAQVLASAGEDFRRTTDFKTLPNGERVLSLAEYYGIPVMGFSYSVFLGRNVKPETTGEFR